MYLTEARFSDRCSTLVDFDAWRFRSQPQEYIGNGKQF